MILHAGGSAMQHDAGLRVVGSKELCKVYACESLDEGLMLHTHTSDEAMTRGGDYKLL